MRRTVNRRRAGSLAPGSVLGMAALFAVLIALNVYFFFYRRGTSLPHLLRQAEHQKEAVLGRGAPGRSPGEAKKKGAPARRAEDQAVELVAEGPGGSGELGPDGNIEAALRREGVSARATGEAAVALRKLVDPRSLRGGCRYLLRRDGEDGLRSFELRPTPEVGYRVERRGDGWRVLRIAAPLETHVVDVAVTVETSLFEAVERSGEGAALLGALIDVFAWDLNFFLEARRGDRFRVIVEKHAIGGRPHQLGRVLAAEYQGRAATFRAFWYQPRHGEPGYYTAEGEALARSLLPTPLKYARLPASFDVRRLAPVEHSEQARLGVDYAAPSGAPVWAVAGGKVSFRGASGGAGNVVSISHPGGMETHYTHLGRLARGFETGDAVRPKQVIGYVGASTGTGGAYLHYSVKLGGHFVDPLRLRPARSPPLPPDEREGFARAIAPHLATLGRPPTTKGGQE